MTLSLRPYQSGAIDALYGYFAEHTGNPLVVMPTLQTARDPDILTIGDCAAHPPAGQGGTRLRHPQ